MALLSPNDVEGKNYDLISIGSGMGGAAAALRASELGLKVAIVEKGKLGGTCVNVGCVPTKYLLKVSEEVSDVRLMSSRGLIESEIKPNIKMIMGRKNELIDQVIVWYQDYVFPSYDIDVISGYAHIKDPHIVNIDGVDVNTKNIVIATGSLPVLPHIKGLEEARKRGFFMTSDEALSLEEAPDHLIIIGGGAIGVELASVWYGFGSKITIVEMMPRILPNMDVDVSKTLKEIFESKGIKILTNNKVRKIDPEKKEVVLERGESIKADKVLIATGRRPSTEGLGLEKVGVKLGPKGEVIVDNHSRTNISNIYAVGDVTGEPYVASLAKIQGIVAGENVAGIESTYNSSLVPMAIFSDPEVSGVGVSAMKGDPRYIIKRFPAAVNYRAIASERPFGIAKIVADAKTKELLGFHMVGLNASEVVNAAVVAIKKKMKIDEVKEYIFSHPVMSETFLDAMHLVNGVNVYLPKKK